MFQEDNGAGLTKFVGSPYYFYRGLHLLTDTYANIFSFSAHSDFNQSEKLR
jgi:hypothetical protein